MILKFKQCKYQNPVEIIEALGLTWGAEYQGMVLERSDEGVMVDCPDSIADDIKDLIEPFKGKADYALSELKDLTWQQLSNHIDGISSLAEARTYLKKLSFVVMALVKHTHIDK